jgi:MFS family permease
MEGKSSPKLLRRPAALLTALGLAQIISWGSFYYAFALLIPSLSAHLRTSTAGVVAAFSLALLVSGLLSAPVGHWIDRHGGRHLMAGGTLAGALLLLLMSQVQNLEQLYMVWAAVGVVMATTLYDPAFAVMAQLFRSNGPRKAITTLTLFGGFASTVFWPLTQILLEHLSWQQSLWVLAAINLLISAPLQWWALAAQRPATVRPMAPAASASGSASAAGAGGMGLRELLRQPLFLGLCAAFTLNTLVFSAMSVHLIGLLQSRQLSLAQAAWVGASIGPVQVFGRAIEYLGRLAPSRLGLLVILMLPLALCALLLSQGVSASLALFVLLYGMGNGMITIVRGALPAALYGTQRYGLINGAMATPVLMAKAAGPLIAALLLGPLDPQTLLGLMAATAAGAALCFAWALRQRHG